MRELNGNAAGAAHLEGRDKEIVAAYMAGTKVQDIAHELGLSEARVYQILKRMRVGASRTQ